MIDSIDMLDLLTLVGQHTTLTTMNRMPLKCSRACYCPPRRPRLTSMLYTQPRQPREVIGMFKLERLSFGALSERLRAYENKYGYSTRVPSTLRAANSGTTTI